MAFWKKGEDPWDVDPAKQRTVSRVTETPDRFRELQKNPLDSLKDWVEDRLESQREQLIRAAEKCPWCGGDMEQGFLNGGRGVFWTRGVPDTRTKWLGAGRENLLRVDNEGVVITYKTAWRCPACEKMVFDAAGLRPEGDPCAGNFGEPPEKSPYTGCFGDMPGEGGKE